jgi:AcrR family transcriptional regulator
LLLLSTRSIEQSFNKSQGLKMTRLNAADRRDAILDAAAQLMIEKGWFATSTRDVTARLSVGAGLLHHYFSGWKELQLQAVRRAFTLELVSLEIKCHGLPQGEAMAAIIDWLIPDPGDGFWCLWIDMQGAARTDASVAAELSTVMAQLVAMVSDIVSFDGSGANLPDAARQRVLALLAASQGLAAMALTAPPLINAKDHEAVLAELTKSILA